MSGPHSADTLTRARCGEVTMVITEDLLQWLLADQKVATWRIVRGVW